MSFNYSKQNNLLIDDQINKIEEEEDLEDNYLGMELEKFNEEIDFIHEKSEIFNNHKEMCDKLTNERNIVPMDSIKYSIDSKSTKSSTNPSTLSENVPSQILPDSNNDNNKMKSYTTFPTLPSQRVFVNLHHTRYDILKKVLGEAPFYFKISNVEPYGEEWETDSDGNRKCEKVENPEFLMQDVIWVDSYQATDKFVLLKNYQKINHFPGMQLLTRKNQLAKLLVKMRKLLGTRDFGFFPKTYLMPQELKDLKADCLRQQREGKKRQFIMKPEGLSQGKGIQLIRGFQDLDPDDDSKLICQKQLMHPLLIDGLKFDLRIYVLVTSVDPLRVFIHEDGFLRFCTQKQEEPASSNLNNLCMHLTNYAVNKLSRNFVQNNSADMMSDNASKRHLKWFKAWLNNQGVDPEAKFREVEAIIVKTLISVQPQLMHQYKSCQPNDQAGNMCFEVLGFDVIFDSEYNPILLEVNHAPSFATDSEFDYKVKEHVLADTFKILYSVGPRAKKAQQKFKQQELNKKILGKHKFNAEERESIKQFHVESKDEQAMQNLNGYSCIQPSTDPELSSDQNRVSMALQQANNVFMRKRPKPDKGPEHPKAVKSISVPDEPQPKVFKSKEEIDSIVNRLYYNRLHVPKVQQEQRMRDDHYDRNYTYLNTPVVNLNLNGEDHPGCTDDLGRFLRVRPQGQPVQLVPRAAIDRAMGINPAFNEPYNPVQNHAAQENFFNAVNSDMKSTITKKPDKNQSLPPISKFGTERSMNVPDKQDKQQVKKSNDLTQKRVSFNQNQSGRNSYTAERRDRTEENMRLFSKILQPINPRDRPVLLNDQSDNKFMAFPVHSSRNDQDLCVNGKGAKMSSFFNKNNNRQLNIVTRK